MYGNTRVHVNNQSPNSALQCELKLVSSRAEKKFLLHGRDPAIPSYLCLFMGYRQTNPAVCHMQGQILDKVE